MATLLVALASGAWPARAQVDATAAARALFAEGVDAATAEDWSTAEDRFARALALRWAPPIAYNLAQAQIRRGRYVAATENLRAVLRSEDTEPDLLEAAAPLLAEAESQLGRLVVHVRGDREGLTVRVGAEEVPEAMWDVAIPVDPGALEVVALRDGNATARAEARVAPRERAEVILEIPEAPTAEAAARAALAAEERQLTRAAATPPRERAPADARRRRRRIIVGSAIAVVAVAAIGTVLALTLGADPAPPAGDLAPGALPGSVF